MCCGLGADRRAGDSTCERALADLRGTGDKIGVGDPLRRERSAQEGNCRSIADEGGKWFDHAATPI
jgi:hypothetical protein